jgi:hypothetical protein
MKSSSWVILFGFERKAFARSFWTGAFYELFVSLGDLFLIPYTVACNVFFCMNYVTLPKTSL